VIVSVIIKTAQINFTDCNIYAFTHSSSPICCHLFVVGVADLTDPDSYAVWSFYTPDRVFHVGQVEGKRSEKVAAHQGRSDFSFIVARVYLWNIGGIINLIFFLLEIKTSAGPKLIFLET